MEDKEYKEEEIEFEGEINDKAKKFLYKKYKITLFITFFCLFILFGVSGPPFVLIMERLIVSNLFSWEAVSAMYFEWIYWLVDAIVCFLLCLMTIKLSKKSFEKEYPVNIKINYIVDIATQEIAMDDIILYIEDKHKSKHPQPKKSFLMKDVRKVIDHGDWYHIVIKDFGGRYVCNLFFCQKDLLVKGTIQDFEMIFDGMIVRKSNKIN
jgi:hypothetical protein